MKNFEPNIIGFVCNWCTYAGADLAGSSRYSYPPNVKLIRLMCSGRVDPAFILETFARGADGVFVGGCHIPSDCHYQQGNFKALKRVTMLKKLISEMGVEPDRLEIFWISASEGKKFSEVMTSFTERIKKLGPNPIKV
ncbi:MAG: hydrogenase MvhADGHdrABC F420-non-reducing hydrogenase subunit D [Candidatus Methanofastidiosum methylothiophilum]|jgi:F420-non-reducing hydrogenase iron-sulfur subunit|uniref:Hydrogenase MvhADGHdrABC F420-non-reducing hydrogenase subunit D n=1 Tax=Candidatus Methanofastidiosum methylothiophilum TaxID=1705564 RepID=A0A150JLG9_9EURY|nr:MAG: hydrogenase MvhADGHdrABC F420-non-reducing hydrogenase subunit D [Candidatus Methanofastidiosum methylthiophilus]MBP6932305.1 hydrogenase iron-sulfur subunit [Methanofastidiosum sp.]OQC49486.1 MAG: F420-non-reducing hydrogenase iron-sulfur subunit D [Euryarchaeota archaeon ADurb.Bin023]KYC57005.1 MAG: hydrogenase MvhADGHdrABC F420-non-reducing hydrogenase subunit D [Candidatus Methanofastidiosum methylthiophilus]KYC57971.1 MAG: hydrogenase MvhADGHdrABC F420-non-reducing hydrogenase subu